MFSHLLFKDKLTILFCLLYDFLALLPNTNRALISGRNPAGRPANLTSSEVLTLALFHFWTTLGNWKAFYALMAAGFRQEFPKLPCYETLLRQINAHGPLGLLLLIALLGRQGLQASCALRPARSTGQPTYHPRQRSRCHPSRGSAQSVAGTGSR